MGSLTVETHTVGPVSRLALFSTGEFLEGPAVFAGPFHWARPDQKAVGAMLRRGDGCVKPPVGAKGEGPYQRPRRRLRFSLDNCDGGGPRAGGSACVPWL